MNIETLLRALLYHNPQAVEVAQLYLTKQTEEFLLAEPSVTGCEITQLLVTCDPVNVNPYACTVEIELPKYGVKPSAKSLLDLRTRLCAFLNKEFHDLSPNKLFSDMFVLQNVTVIFHPYQKPKSGD